MECNQPEYDYLRMIEIKPLCRFRLRVLKAGAEEFYASSKALRKFDIDKFVSFWKDVIEKEMGVIFVAEDDDGETIGAIGAMIHREPYSDEVTVHEFFWFVRPDHRGFAGIRLYRELEKWAKAKNANIIRMVHLTDSMPEKLSRFYTGLGFTPVETVYSKEVA
jgi:GNAT superfamily N-acetyltransferase